MRRLRRFFGPSSAQWQNLIIEGCYVSINWREGLLGYLDQVVFRALIPTQDYPVHHFADLKRHAPVIEHRIDDTSFTADEVLANLPRWAEMKQGITVSELISLDGSLPYDELIEKAVSDIIVHVTRFL